MAMLFFIFKEIGFTVTLRAALLTGTPMKGRVEVMVMNFVA